MKNILVPFDFSDHAESALQFAIEFNEVSHGRITLVYVIEYPLGNTFNITGEIGQLNNEDKILTIELIKRMKAKLELFVNSDQYRGYHLNYQIMMGNPYDGIAKIVEETNIDLIIMGTQGATGLKEMIVGSNAEKVVRNAKCPVITVHHGQKFENIRNVVFATELNTEHNVALDLFKSNQEIFDAKIHLVWVFTPHSLIAEEIASEKLEQIALKHGLKNYKTHVERGYFPEEGILHYAKSNQADMIALATHSYKGLARLFLGSTTADLVNHSHMPIWSMSMKAIPQLVK